MHFLPRVGGERSGSRLRPAWGRAWEWPSGAALGAVRGTVPGAVLGAARVRRSFSPGDPGTFFHALHDAFVGSRTTAAGPASLPPPLRVPGLPAPKWQIGNSVVVGNTCVDYHKGPKCFRMIPLFPMHGEARRLGVEVLGYLGVKMLVSFMLLVLCSVREVMNLTNSSFAFYIRPRSADSPFAGFHF